HRPLGKQSIGHLENKLHEKNVRIKELKEQNQKLQTHLGNRMRQLNKALNDLNGAILNDRQSREENRVLKREMIKIREMINAVEKGKIQEGGQQQHQNRDESRQTTEASGSNCS